MALNANNDQVTLEPSLLFNMLPTFENGENENFQVFLKQFNSITELANWSDSIKIIFIKTKLRNAALKVLEDNDSLQNETNYARLCELLSKKFSKCRDFSENIKLFMGLKQLKNELVQVFAERCQKQATEFLRASALDKNQGASELTNKLLFANFIQGLNPQLKFEIEKIAPDNLEDAIQRATKIEKAINKYNNEDSMNIDNNKTQELITNLIQQYEQAKIQRDNLTEQINDLKFQKKNQQKQFQRCTSGLKTDHTQNCIFNRRQSNDDSDLITYLITQYQEAQEKIDKLTEDVNYLNLQMNNIKQPSFCTICKRNNHSEQNCFYKPQYRRSRNYTQQRFQKTRTPQFFKSRANRGFSQNYSHTPQYAQNDYISNNQDYADRYPGNFPNSRYHRPELRENQTTVRRQKAIKTEAGNSDSNIAQLYTLQLVPGDKTEENGLAIVHQNMKSPYSSPKNQITVKQNSDDISRKKKRKTYENNSKQGQFRPVIIDPFEQSISRDTSPTRDRKSPYSSPKSQIKVNENSDDITRKAKRKTHGNNYKHGQSRPIIIDPFEQFTPIDTSPTLESTTQNGENLGEVKPSDNSQELYTSSDVDDQIVRKQFKFKGQTASNKKKQYYDKQEKSKRRAENQNAPRHINANEQRDFRDNKNYYQDINGQYSFFPTSYYSRLLK